MAFHLYVSSHESLSSLIFQIYCHIDCSCMASAYFHCVSSHVFSISLSGQMFCHTASSWMVFPQCVSFHVFLNTLSGQNSCYCEQLNGFSLLCVALCNLNFWAVFDSFWHTLQINLFLFSLFEASFWSSCSVHEVHTINIFKILQQFFVLHFSSSWFPDDWCLSNCLTNMNTFKEVLFENSPEQHLQKVDRFDISIWLPLRFLDSTSKFLSVLV